MFSEDENAAALAELEDVPMAAKKKRTINRGPKLDSKRWINKLITSLISIAVSVVAFGLG